MAGRRIAIFADEWSTVARSRPGEQDAVKVYTYEVSNKFTLPFLVHRDVLQAGVRLGGGVVDDRLELGVQAEVLSSRSRWCTRGRPA